MAILLGAHVDNSDPLGNAAIRKADVIQIHLVPPQVWDSPPIHPRSDELVASNLPIYVHAPYLLNPASLNKNVRRMTRKALKEQIAAAQAIGARGVVVHGGHPTGQGTIEDGIAGWLEVLSGWYPEVPILIENTAGGNAAVARHLSSFSKLWKQLSFLDSNVGYCLDTCHAWASGEDPTDLVGRTLEVTGRIDLVHLNDSKDPQGSSRDRHENLGSGQINKEWLVNVVKEANTHTVVETRNGPEAQAKDILWIRERL